MLYSYECCLNQINGCDKANRHILLSVSVSIIFLFSFSIFFFHKMTFCLSTTAKRSVVEMKIRTLRFLDGSVGECPYSTISYHNYMIQWCPHIARTRIIFRLHVMRSTLYICENAPPTRHDRYRYQYRKYRKMCAISSYVRFHFIFHGRLLDSLHVQWLLLHPQVHWKYYQSASSTRKAFDQWGTKVSKVFKYNGLFHSFFHWTEIISSSK